VSKVFKSCPPELQNRARSSFELTLLAIKVSILCIQTCERKESDKNREISSVQTSIEQAR
jgi:hypothetical protein